MKILIFAAFLTIATANYDKSKFDVKNANLLIPSDKEKFLSDFSTSSNARRRGRISNGNDASDIAYPYAIEVITRWRTGLMESCSGAIISTTYIITARECIIDDSDGQTALTIMIQAGAACRCSTRIAIFTQWATWLDRNDAPGPHPNFGLALLSQSIVTSPAIQIVRLPTFAQSLSWFDLMPAFIAGWGETEIGLVDNLQHGRVIITVRGQNNEAFVPGITEYELLARAAPEFPGLEIKYGDQGGPMVINEGGTHTLVGTLWTTRLYNDGSLSENMITAFRIGHFWDFIHDVTGIPRRF